MESRYSKYKESYKRAADKYKKDHFYQLCLKFNTSTDEDIIKKLDSVPNKMGYIKELIRKDMSR